MSSQNPYRYEVNHDWAKLPDGVAFGYTHGIALDKQGRVFIFNMSKDAVMMFDDEGHFLQSWGEEFASGAHGMKIHEEHGVEYLYLSDIERGLVIKTTLEGRTVMTLSAPNHLDLYGPGEDGVERKFVPTDVAVAPNGDIYVADGYGQSYIHKFNPDGTYLLSWGGKGTAQGQLDCPHGVSIDMRTGEPLVYVADRGNRRIQVFSLDGEPLQIISDDLHAPCSFSFHGEDLYIPDLMSRVTILGQNNRLISHIGETEDYKKEGWPNLPKGSVADGTFSSPHSVCVAPNGDIYVVEWVEYGRVTKLSRI
ncbi:hypothetical protein ACFQZR_13775 [Paenibacillus sp. GCM10027629]|uniref:hypothetical protein n=1 Tax=Paenibacillus sp. GCM10027629 TaxID=3273414 RepID=UPI00363AA01D